MEGYFVCHMSEDGIGIRGPLSKEKAIEFITPDEHGETHYGPDLEFLSKLPEKYGQEWSENSIVIIKGEIVTPTEKTIVTKLELK
jgi:hypothetical protein